MNAVLFGATLPLAAGGPGVDVVRMVASNVGPNTLYPRWSRQ